MATQAMRPRVAGLAQVVQLAGLATTMPHALGNGVAFEVRVVPSLWFPNHLFCGPC